MKVLVLHAKHGDQYWLADTPGHEDWAFLQMFKYCNDEQYYFDLKPDPSQEKEREKLRSKLKALGDKRELAEERKELKHRLRAYESEDEARAYQYELFQKAKAGDAKAARLLCRQRQEYEYESFGFVDVGSP